MSEETNPIPPIPEAPIPQAPMPKPSGSSESQEFVQTLNYAMEFLKLDFRNLERVANDPKMPVWVVVILAISGVASAIGTLNIVGIVINPILSILFGSLFLALFWVIAGPLFGGKASIVQHYNALGILLVVQWVSVIPVIGPIVSFFVFFYMVFVYQKIIKLLHGLSEGKAWAVVLIPIAVLLFIGFILFVVFGLAILGIVSAAAASGG